jgi:two-component sensor histidine kinase
VLVAELQHRTRNLLAVVQSVMRQTIRASASLEEFDRRFAGRLAALGRAQEMLARADGEPVTIQELAHTELAAHGAEPDGERVSLDGPPVELPRRGLETLALAVHELATNAVKYGALSLPAGRLTIVWTLSVERDGESRLLTLEWRETGVEMPDPDIGKRRRGFGRELIERALPYQLNAETELEFTPEGVRCRILMPLH